MANLTINVDAETLKQARIRALEEDTSVNAVLARYLATYARAEKKQLERKKALNNLLKFSAGHPIDRGDRPWVREGSMTVERWFFDTNVLVYLFDEKAPEKQQITQALLKKAVTEAEPVISTQVLQEFFVTVTRAKGRALSVPEARQFMHELTKIMEVRQITTSHIFAATERLEQSRISFLDSLIVETAREAGATILWTEDLHDGWNADGTHVRNPFQVENP